MLTAARNCKDVVASVMKRLATVTAVAGEFSNKLLRKCAREQK
jgi:hypothetical protein